jgi:hypothetical protein
MNKIIFIDTKRNLRAKPALQGGLRAFHHASAAVGPARSALTCVWRVDPGTGRLVASWSLAAIDELSHCCSKPHFANGADIARAARAA